MAKENNGFWKKVGVIAGILVTLLTAAVAYGVLTARVQDNCRTLAIIEPIVNMHDSSIGRIEVKQELTLKTVEKMDDKLDRIEEKLSDW